MIRIGSNIFSLNAQRRLADTTNLLSDTFERLSSGQRINKASDDAAGLAISESLKNNVRVYSQAIRNVNDGVSALNIAQGALSELSGITIRQKELAAQAANGTYSLKQRQLMNEEVNALVDEYNRIVQSAQFNGIKLTDNSLTELRVQAGYGLDGSIGFDIGSELARTVGDGSFASRISYASGEGTLYVALSDVNNDNILDMVSANSVALTATVFLGLGDGSFSTTTSVVVGNAYALSLNDVNNDGNVDIISADTGYNKVRVSLGRGDGTFENAISHFSGIGPVAVSLGDLDNDGDLDIVVANNSGDTMSVLMGNGDGSFSSYTSFAAGVKPYGLALSDMNGDGKLDMVKSNPGSNSIDVLLGRGNGSFAGGITLVTDDAPHQVTTSDIDGDGIEDIIVANRNSGNINIFIGNGDGSFSAKRSFLAGNGCRSLAAADLNGDGYLDIATGDQYADGITVLIGNGDGTFYKRADYFTGEDVTKIVLGDLNNDGALDIATANFTENSVAVLLANAQEVSITPYLNINTRQGALEVLDVLENTLQRISRELGIIGSS